MSRQFDPLHHHGTDHYSVMQGGDGGSCFDLGSSLEFLHQKDRQQHHHHQQQQQSNAHSMPMTSRGMNYAGFTTLDGLLSQECPPTTNIKPSSWGSSTVVSSEQDQFHSSRWMMSPAFSTNSSVQSACVNPHQHPQVFSHVMSPHLDGFSLSHPQHVHDELAALRNQGGNHMDLRNSPGSVGQESCISDPHSVEGLNNGANPGAVNESNRCNKRKPELLPLDIRFPRSSPVNNPPPTVAATKSMGHTQDHIMAERKRREKLSQRFIALSAIVPGLKKV